MNLIVAVVASGVLAVVTAMGGLAALQDEPTAPNPDLVRYADE
jgi:hypothetical protein